MLLPALGAAAFLLTVAVYARVIGFGFVNYDDPEYTYDNPHVNAGLTVAGVRWAFGNSYAANWHPLTWISHMLDFQLYGVSPGMHHATSVLLHAGSVVLLFFLLKSMTGAVWPSLFVAFGFGLHPAHVESVAWIAERKDVLCAFFFFAALWAYVAYVRRPVLRLYLVVCALLLCALLSKQMAVSFPFVALVLDFWPLGRPFRLSDKIPFFLMGAAAGVAAVVAQSSAGAILSFERIPLWVRLANLPLAYAGYIRQLLIPTNLAVFYPYRSHIELWGPVASGALLLVITGFAWRERRRRPYLLAGWSWFVITLLPVVGILQIGAQAHADRYTYIPFVGLFIAAAWLLKDFAGALAPGVAAVFGAVWVFLTVVQIGYWHDSVTLFQHAIAVTENNALAYNNLGQALSTVHETLPQAIAAYEQAIQIQPSYAKAHFNVGTALLDLGRTSDGVRELEVAIKLDPRYASARNNLGKALATDSSALPAAVAQYRSAIGVDGTRVDAHVNLANALAEQGQLAESSREYQTALRLDPKSATAHFNYANLLAQTGQDEAAILEYRAAIQAQPDFPEAQNNLGTILAHQPGRLAEAVSAFKAALASRPGYTDAHFNLANTLAQMPGRMPDAIAEWRATTTSDPRHFQAHYNLGVALAGADRPQDAIAEFQAAYSIRPDPAIPGILEQLRTRRRH
jgi:tetratricopeptide (TPR) repeat protein